MPKVVDADQYRKQLLYQCFDLFAEKGYANVTTRQIAKALGISTGALYHYFPSKESLFEQLIEELACQDTQLIKSAITPQNTLAEGIARYGKLLLENREYLIKHAAIWMDFFQQGQTETIRESPAFQQFDQQFQQAIAELLGISDLSKARLVWVLGNGIIIDQLAKNDPILYAEQITLWVEMLTTYFDQSAENSSANQS